MDLKGRNRINNEDQQAKASLRIKCKDLKNINYFYIQVYIICLVFIIMRMVTFKKGTFLFRYWESRLSGQNKDFVLHQCFEIHIIQIQSPTL